jgi:hypothetical protein
MQTLNMNCEFTAKCLEAVLREYHSNGTSMHSSFIDVAAEKFPEAIIYATMKPVKCNGNGHYEFDGIGFTEYQAKKICHLIPGTDYHDKLYAIWPVSNLCAGEVLDPSGKQYPLTDELIVTIDTRFRMSAYAYWGYLNKTRHKRAPLVRKHYKVF